MAVKSLDGRTVSERPFCYFKTYKNIFDEGELLKEGNMQILHVANSDKPVEFYNLDVIISVGYRVNSIKILGKKADKD